MSRVKVVLIGGEYDLTRMEIEDKGGYPLEMACRNDMHVISRLWDRDIPTEAVCQIILYYRTIQLRSGVWLYEYRPNE